MSDLQTELLRRLKKLGVEHVIPPGRDDGFSGLRFNGKDLAHFHNSGELDLRLTRKVIEREGLSHPPGSLVHPNRSERSSWIEVRFTRASQLDEVVRLVKLAIEQL